MTIKIYKDYELQSRATANWIRDYIIQKPDAWVCLASGFTPIGVFKCLIDDVRNGALNLKHCKFFSLDEWVGIDPTDSGSCLSMLRKDFFDPLNIPNERIEFFNVQSDDLEAECYRINTLIESHAGLDIMLVGVGTNGHIGMNEPGTSFKSVAHIGALAEETKQVGQKYFSKPTELSNGMTLGLQHLADAQLPIVMANGNKKAAIMKKAFHKQPTEEIPVTIVQLIKQGFVSLDNEAANELTTTA